MRGPLDLARLAVSPLVHSPREADFFQSVPMSSRLTKKSLVSVPGRSVKTPCLAWPTLASEDPQAADQHGHLRGGQGRAGCARSTSACSGASDRRAEVVAEAVRSRLEDGERLDVGLLLRRVRAPRSERNRHVVPGLLRGLLDRGAAAEHDQVRERHLLAARPRTR